MLVRNKISTRNKAQRLVKKTFMRNKLLKLFIKHRPLPPLIRVVKWALLAVMLTAGVAQAHSFKSGDIRIGHPWARPTAEGAKEAFVFMAFLEQGDKTDQLQSAKTSVAQKAVLVQAAPNGDLSEVQGIDLPPGRGVSLRPGAAYIKLTGLKGGLTVGDKFTVRLTFASAPPVDVTIFVQDEPVETAPSHDMHDMKGM